MSVSVNQIKSLREETGASVADIRNALEEAGGDPLVDSGQVEKRARELLKKRGLERAAKKAEREIKAGRVFSYIHHSGTVGGMVVLGCETDFVAKTDEFQKLGAEIAMQVASMNPESKEELLAQDYIREHGTTIEGLIKSVIGKLGENIQLLDFKRCLV